MRIAGVIIGGGAASRLGGKKPFVPFANGVLLDAVLERFSRQTDLLALNLRPDIAECARDRYNVPILLDATGSQGGPLAGVVAALTWADASGDVSWLATVPADTPFLPRDLVVQLKAVARKGAPVHARDAERCHYLCALWPVEALSLIREGFESGTLRSVRSALNMLGATECPIVASLHAFFNVNSPEDLTQAERWYRESAVATS